MKTLHLTVIVLASPLLALPARAQVLDLILGFAQSGATNDVLINFGNVTDYSPGWHNLGNYRSILSANFTDWNVATGSAAVSFGAVAAGAGDGSSGQSTPIYLTSSWDTSVRGTAGVKNSPAWTPVSVSQMDDARFSIAKISAAYGAFSSVGAARAVANTGGNAWTTNVQPAGAVAFGVFSAPQFNTDVSDLAASGITSFAAADLYSLAPGIAGEDPEATFRGTLLVFQSGAIAFAAVPEPAGTALALGGIALAALAIRRRRAAAAASSN